MESYDFERARAQLERAVTASGGAAGPAAALLLLRVETLGDDAAALALQPSLSREALAHPDVRALLALAAARSGDSEEAIALLRGASEQRIAEVSAALASRAVFAGDAEQAAAHLAELRKRDPAHPAILGVADGIARLRAAARGPSEAELAALVAAGRDGEAEKKAAEVLARWPECEVARRVLRGAEERRRLAHEAAEPRVREIEAALQAKREASRVEHVRAQLAAPDPREGLLAWLDLDPALRLRIGEPRAAELCRWLDLTSARATSPARVEAVLAIAVASQRLAGDPQGALDALAPHETTLERVAEARRIAREGAGRDRRATGGAERARRGRRGAPRIWPEATPPPRSGDWTRRRLRDLGDEEHAEAEALRAEAARIVVREKRVADVGRLRRNGHLFEARALADELLAEAPPEERAALGGGEAGRSRRRSSGPSTSRSIASAVPLGMEEGPDATQTMMEAPVWLTEDGRTLVLAEGKRDRVWVQLVDVASRTVRVHMVLRTPEPVDTICFHVLGHTAWLSSALGGLLAIDVEHLTVELFRPAREIVSQGHHSGGAAIAADRGAAGPRYYWVMPADKDDYAYPVLVIDLETRRVVREIPEVIRMGAIAGTREARVGCFKAAGLILHEERGVPVRGGRLPRQDVAVTLATAHPSGEGLVVAGAIATAPWHVIRLPAPGSRRRQRPEVPGPDENHRLMALVERSTHGPARAPWIIGDLGGGTLVGLASSRDTGLVAVTLVRGDLVWEVLVLRPVDGTFELLHREEMPDFTAILRDARARHLFLYSPIPLILTPLGPTAPDLPRESARPSPWINDVSGTPVCLGRAGARAESYRAVAESVRTLPLDAIAATSRALQKQANPDLLVERARALAAATDDNDAPTEARRLRELLWERYPDNARVRLLRADERALLGRWDDVREILAPCSGASFSDDEDHAQHFSHLLALAALRVGDVEEARRRAADAGAHGGSCQLQGLAALVHPRPDPSAPVGEGTEVTAAPSLLTQLVWAIHGADARLAAGDPDGALAALDPLRFDTGDEVQVLARRAEAWLGLSLPPGRRRFATITSPARLIQAHEGEVDEERKELPVPGAMWARSRLDDVVRRATAWLEAQGT